MAWVEGKKEYDSKSSPIAMRMAILVFATIFGLCMCFSYLKQIRQLVGPKYASLVGSNIRIIHEQCRSLDVLPMEKLYLHYPKPTTYSRGECECTPVQFFAILSMQRSGSGWFETFLNSHINVSSNGEIFSVKDRRSNVSAVLSTLDKVYNLDWFSSAAKNECLAAVGFKWMLNQGLLSFHEEIADYFNRRGVSAIFLLRRNLLQRMISILANTYDQSTKQLNGTHKSHVHSEKDVAEEVVILLKDEVETQEEAVEAIFCHALTIKIHILLKGTGGNLDDLLGGVRMLLAEVLAKFKPTINISSLISDLKHAEDMAANGLEYFKSTRHIILYYEDLVNNRTKLIDVQDFLGVPRRGLVSRQVKIHKKALSEQISNWEDVHNVLKETKYKKFLKSARRLF